MIRYLQKMISEAPNQLISYADYMNAALYHPNLGYYMKEQPKIGRQGDFITTSNISDVYGRLMAKWFFFISEKMDLPPVFCEIGAGTGRFAHAFIQEWSESINTPLQYLIVETSPYHRKLQRELLAGFPFVRQIGSLTEAKGFHGVIYSNELFDALPVHVIEKRNGGIFEVMIGLKNGGLCETKVPLSNPAILAFLQETRLELKEKQRIEVPLAMAEMIAEISNCLETGLVVTADYGYTNEEWMTPQRAKGSLRGFYQHRMIDDVLNNPGEMDITTHIHFDYFKIKGQEAGLEWVTQLRQDEFLLKAGILKELEEHFDPNPFSEASKRNRAIRSLIMPSGMSSYFHILIQQKGLGAAGMNLFEE